jgi:hypothetical protein
MVPSQATLGGMLNPSGPGTLAHPMTRIVAVCGHQVVEAALCVEAHSTADDEEP